MLQPCENWINCQQNYNYVYLHDVLAIYLLLLLSVVVVNSVYRHSTVVCGIHICGGGCGISLSRTPLPIIQIYCIRIVSGTATTGVTSYTVP